MAMALLAWFAQLCLPLAHASMAAPRAAMLAWCGEPSRALAAAAELPAEIREALGLDGASADHVVDCAKLCATGSTSAPTAVVNVEVLRAAGLEPAPATRTEPPRQAPAPRPPSQGPPAHG
jgi:hypothetical protein